jgi:cytoskeleton protein RodZ
MEKKRKNMSGMEKIDDSARPVDPQSETVTDGKYDLKSIREARGISLHDIFRVSRVSVINLEAIEKGDFHLLPTPFIAKSFIKTYAKAIGVDAETIIRQYDTFIKTRDKIPVEEKTEEPAQDKRKQTRIIGLSLLGAAVVCIIVYLVYSFYPMLNEWGSMRTVQTSTPAAENSAPATPPNASAETQNAPPMQVAAQPSPSAAVPLPAVPASTTAPAPSSAPTSPAAAAGTHQLVIEATGFSWIKIIEDRKPPVEILMKPGEKIERTAFQSFELDIGNAGGTNIVYQGKPLGVLGKPGQVVHLKLP